MIGSKGYTDKLEKLYRDDSGLAVTIGKRSCRQKVKIFTQKTTYFYLTHLV